MKCNSKDNSLTFLRNKKVIDEMRILKVSPERFNTINDSLLSHAKETYKYDLDTPFYTLETIEKKAVGGHNYHRDNKYTMYLVTPNEEAFTRLDELRAEMEVDDKTYAPIDFFEDFTYEGEEVTPDYNKYIEYKKSLLSRLNNRLARIESEKKKASSDKETLKALTSLESEIKLRVQGEEALGIKGLLDEISELEKAPPISKVEYYAEKDLERLDVLSKSQNEEDLHEARSIINFYEALGTFDVKMVNPFFTREDMFDNEGNLTLPSSTVAKLAELRDKAKKYENIIEQKEKITIVNNVNNNSKVQQTFQGKQFQYEQLFYEGQGLKDIPWADMFLMDITNGIFSKNGIVPQVMMNTIQNSFERNLVYAKSVETRMNALQGDLERELTKLGYKISIPGLKGVSYDLFRAVDENGQYKDTITQRYSNQFIDAKSKMFYEFDSALKKARDIEDPVTKQKAYTEAFKTRENWYKKNTVIIDVRKIPEVLNDSQFGNFIGDFKSEQSEAYVTELKEILGEQGYKEEVDKQIKLLKDYNTMLEVFTDNIIVEYAVEDESQLPKEALDKIETWEKKNSPFEMVKSYYEGTPITRGKLILNSSMSYNYSVPRKTKASIKFEDNKLVAIPQEESTGYYDERFKTIESNETLKEFHNLLTEVNQKMYDILPLEMRDKFSASSIPALKKNLVEILFDKNTPLYQRLSEAARYIYDKIRSLFGMNPEDTLSYTTVDPITGRPEYKVNSSFLKGNKENINNKHFIEMQRIKKALGMSATDSIKKYDRFDLTKMNSEAIAILAESLGVAPNIASIQKRLPTEDMKSIELSKVLKSAITDQVVQENSFDLPKILKLYSYMTMEYAARQEVLPTIEMMKKHYEQIKNPTITSIGDSVINASSQETRLEGERNNAIRQMDSWFERVVLGNYGSKNELGDTRIKRAAKLGVTGNEKIDALTAKLQVTVTGKILNTEEKILRNKLPELQSELQNIVNTAPSDSPEYKKANNILANMNRIEESLGRQFSITSLFDAMFNFLRFKGLGWNVSSYVTNFAEGQIANLTIAASGDYFTPENIYRANDIVKGSFLKNMSFGKIATEGAKKTRILMDRYRVLQDASNELQKASSKSAFSKFNNLSPYEGTRRTEYLNQAPIMLSVLFDTIITGKNGETSNVYDAMTVEGLLKEEFKTEANIKNWEQADGDQYNDFASHIKKTIVNTHGDYDELRGNMASERISGKALLMFKRWVSRQLYQRFATVPQADIEVGIQNYKGRYLSHTPASGFLHGAIIGFGGLGILGAGGLGIAIGGGAGFLAARFYGANTGMNFLQESALVGKELFMNMMRIPVNNLTGKNLIKSDKFNQSLEATELDERDVRNLKANLIDMAMTMGWVAALLFTKALLWDDDDDEGDARRQAHNLLANRFMQLSGQATMYVNPVEMKKTFTDLTIIKFFGDVGKTAVDAQNFLEGKDTYASGPNAGESKLLNQLSKTFLPSPIKPALGFESQMQRQFTKSPFDSWFVGEEKQAKSKTKEIRAIYRNELIDSGAKAEDIDKMVNEKYKPKEKEQSYSDLLQQYGG